MDVNLPGSIFLRESSYGYAAMLVSHAVTMGVFVGLIAMMDLRLMGIANGVRQFSQLQKSLFPWQMGFMIASSVSGCCFSTPNPCATMVTLLLVEAGADGARWCECAGVSPDHVPLGGAWIAMLRHRGGQGCWRPLARYVGRCPDVWATHGL